MQQKADLAETTLRAEYLDLAKRANRIAAALKALGASVPGIPTKAKLENTVVDVPVVRRARKGSRNSERANITLEALRKIERPMALEDFLRDGPAKGCGIVERKRWRNSVYNIHSRMGDNAPFSLRNGVIYPVRSDS